MKLILPVVPSIGYLYYAALGVPEVCRYDGQTLTILSLQNGEYVSLDRSTALALLKAEDIVRFGVADCRMNFVSRKDAKAQRI